ncbi:MAG: hypothetical protein WKF59_21895 [Chitinophagaceae bacterium]
MKIKFYSTVILFAFINTTAFAQSNKNTPPALSAITEADLKRDLYAMAADKFKGRSAGTIDEMNASMWCADQMRLQA